MRPLHLRWSILLTLIVLLVLACSDGGDGAADATLAPTTTEVVMPDEAADEKEADKGPTSNDKGECPNSLHEASRTVIDGSASREYILHVPASYDPAVPAPLVINFHGFGGCAVDYADTIGELHGLHETANAATFIVAYPQAVVREKGDAYWEPGDAGGQDIIVNDVFFTQRLIAAIGEELNVDTARVYATGYSNGGMMAYDLACSASDHIAAAGIMSGIMLAEDCDDPGFTSIIHFHGIADQVIPYDGSGDFPPVSAAVDAWLDHNSIPADSLVTTEFDGGSANRQAYSGGIGNTAFELYTVYDEYDKEGGHVWFSDDIGGKSPNQILWDFLSSYGLTD